MRKEALVKENRAVQNSLSEERLEQKEVVTALKKENARWKVKFRKKQKQIAAYDKEIQRLIRAAIAASNKAAGKGKAAVFTLTPEAQLIGGKTSPPTKENCHGQSSRAWSLWALVPKPTPW